MVYHVPQSRFRGYVPSVIVHPDRYPAAQCIQWTFNGEPLSLGP